MKHSDQTGWLAGQSIRHGVPGEIDHDHAEEAPPIRAEQAHLDIAILARAIGRPVHDESPFEDGTARDHLRQTRIPANDVGRLLELLPRALRAPGELVARDHPPRAIIDHHSDDVPVA